MAQLSIDADQLAALLAGLAAGKTPEEVVQEHVDSLQVPPVHVRLDADLADHRMSPFVLREAFASIHARLDALEHPEDTEPAPEVGEEDQADTPAASEPVKARKGTVPKWTG